MEVVIMNEALCCLNYRVSILIFTSAGLHTFICVNVFCTIFVFVFKRTV